MNNDGLGDKNAKGMQIKQLNLNKQSLTSYNFQINKLPAKSPSSLPAGRTMANNVSWSAEQTVNQVNNNSIMLAGSHNKQSANAPTTLHYFWPTLLLTVIGPNLVSMLLFARAYLRMKRFKSSRLHNASSLNSACLSSVLMGAAQQVSSPAAAAAANKEHLEEPFRASSVEQSRLSAESATNNGAKVIFELPQTQPATNSQDEIRVNELSARRDRQLSRQSAQQQQQQPQLTFSYPPAENFAMHHQVNQAMSAPLQRQLPAIPPASICAPRAAHQLEVNQREVSFSAPPSASPHRLQEQLDIPSLLLEQQQPNQSNQFEFSRRHLHARSFHHYGSALRRAPCQPPAQWLAPAEQQLQSVLERHRSLPKSSRLYHCATRPETLVEHQQQQQQQSMCYPNQNQYFPEADARREHSTSMVSLALANVIKSMDQELSSADSKDEVVDQDEDFEQPQKQLNGDKVILQPPASEQNCKLVLCTYTNMTDDQLLKSNMAAFLVNLTLWLPLVLLHVCLQYRGQLSQELKDSVWWLATLNCCSCSYIYALTNKDFREAFNKLFYYCCCKSHVTFQRKTPIFRRQLELDAKGNLRLHIIPGLNLYSNKLLARSEMDHEIAPKLHHHHHQAMHSTSQVNNLHESNSPTRMVGSLGAGFGGPLFASTRMLSARSDNN